MTPNDPLKAPFQIPPVHVGWPFVAVTGTAALTMWYWFGSEDTRATLEFGVLTGAVAAGVLSAHYVWLGLKTSIQQRNEILAEEKVKLALRFLSRWNAGALADLRRDWLEVLDQLERDPNAAVAALQGDISRRATIAAVLNFCEEMGHAAHSGAADITTLEKLFKGLCLKYYRVTRPWIELRRGDNARAWREFEWLCDQWK